MVLGFFVFAVAAHAAFAFFLLQLAIIDILAIGLALRLGETASLQLEKGKRSLRRRHVETKTKE